MAATAETPVASTGRATTPTLVACLCAFVVMVMGSAGLGGAYSYSRYAIRRANPGEKFFAKEMKFNNYAAFILLFTFVLASLAIGWAVTSLRVNNRRWSAGGFGFTVVLNLAAMNILWFIGSEWEAAVNANPWWLHAYTLLFFAGLVTLAATIAAGLGLARVVTGQANAEQPHQAMAASWIQHAALVVWIVVYTLIFLYK